MRRQYLIAIAGACLLALVAFLVSPSVQTAVENSPAFLASPAASTTATTSATTSPKAEPAPALPTGNLVTAASSVRAVLVNIICNSSASDISSISGSGIVIAPTGIILTNAHIGQYFLLANRGVSCVIRTGNPARNAYTAAPIFISPAWIAGNPNVLAEAAPTGTGEHDIALLAITGSAASSTLPTSFPYLPLERGAPLSGEGVVIGSYAAQFLNTSQIESALSPTIVYGSIKQLFTFTASSIDQVSLGGSAAAQEGSSGGGIIDASGELTGLITTSTTEGSTASRNLAGITATYIRRDYQAETGTSLDVLLATPTSTSAIAFAKLMPALEAVITADLK